MRFKIEPSIWLMPLRWFGLNELARRQNRQPSTSASNPSGFRGDLSFAMARLPHGFRHTERPRCCRSSSRHLGQGIFGLWAICARSTFSSGDNPGRRCSRSELGATPQSREEFRELAAWYTNLESSHHYANRPVLSTVTAPGYGSRARPVARGVSASTIRTMLCRGLRCLGSEFSERSEERRVGKEGGWE